jgi:hypothetical protein
MENREEIVEQITKVQRTIPYPSYFSARDHFKPRPGSTDETEASGSAVMKAVYFIRRLSRGLLIHVSERVSRALQQKESS